MTERHHIHFSFSCIGEGNGSPLQCSCLENPRDGGAWWAAIYGVAQSQTRLKWLSSSSSRTVLMSITASCSNTAVDTFSYGRISGLFLAPFSFLKDISEEWSPHLKNPNSSHKHSRGLSRKTEAVPALTCSFLFPDRTSILGISFGAAFLSLAFILFVCFAGQLLVGTSHMEFLWKVCSLKTDCSIKIGSLLIYCFTRYTAQ